MTSCNKKKLYLQELHRGHEKSKDGKNCSTKDQNKDIRIKMGWKSTRLLRYKVIRQQEDFSFKITLL